MGFRAHVVKKYVVEYGTTYYADEFDKMLRRIQSYPPYADVVQWSTISGDVYELDRHVLESVRDDSCGQDVPDDLRTFARDVLAYSDPALHYVRVELF